MGDNLIFMMLDNLGINAVYTCTAYRYVPSSCGYHYIIQVSKKNTPGKKVMNVTEGVIFDQLEELRSTNSNGKFTFVKKSIPMADTSASNQVVLPSKHEFTNFL